MTKFKYILLCSLLLVSISNAELSYSEKASGKKHSELSYSEQASGKKHSELSYSQQQLKNKD